MYFYKLVRILRNFEIEKKKLLATFLFVQLFKEHYFTSIFDFVRKRLNLIKLILRLCFINEK